MRVKKQGFGGKKKGGGGGPGAEPPGNFAFLSLSRARGGMGMPFLDSAHLDLPLGKLSARSEVFREPKIKMRNFIC